jgi:Glyoxalase-like domain
VRHSRWSCAWPSALLTLPGILFVAAGALGQSDSGIIDHVRVLVHDMGACQDVYRNTLGFDLSHAEALVYQEGSAHNSSRLADGTYVELVGIADRDKLLNARPWIVHFLHDHQGVHSVGGQTPRSLGRNLGRNDVHASLDAV